MNNEGKYPFEGTPNIITDFSEEKSKEQKDEEKSETEEKTHETSAPAPKPSWAKYDYEFTNTELQMPHVIDKPRAIENPQEEQNYDVIQDNNVSVGIELKSEWDNKVWEAPAPEIGDD